MFIMHVLSNLSDDGWIKVDVDVVMQTFEAYLIFVTDTRTVSVEKKSVMWRNFKFLYITDEEKSKISPHVD